MTYRDTWPHGFVLSQKDHQSALLATICARFRDDEGVACTFFHTENTYLFIGDHKYWLMTDYRDIDLHYDEEDYVINRARLYRDRRDFCIQPGDTGKADDYPVSLPN